AMSSIDEALQAAGSPTEARELARDIVRFNFERMFGVFDGGDAGRRARFDFDVMAFSADPRRTSLADYRLPGPTEYVFSHDAEQKNSINSYVSLFGQTPLGISRILTRIFFRKVFRHPEQVNSSSAAA